MRQALRQVREALGPDAVILSNRKIAEGIELVAAIDFDEASFAEAQREQQESQQPQASPPSGRASSDPASMASQTSNQTARMAKAQIQTQLQPQAQLGPRPESLSTNKPKVAEARTGVQASKPAMPFFNGYKTPEPESKTAPKIAKAQAPIHKSQQPATIRPRPEASAWQPLEEELDADSLSLSAAGARRDDFLASKSQIHVKPQATAEKPGIKPEADSGESPILVEMRREMEQMKRMMQNEFSMLGWEEMGRKRPDSQELFRRLMSLDLSADLCQGLARKVEQLKDGEQAWRKALAILAASLPIYKNDLLDEGGLVALVGPTGVGKTTSLAKLAARFCLRHGNRHLGLISADAWRLGGQEQLVQYARLLDVPVRAVNSTRDLEIALNAFADKRLVLIDTAGMGQRDARLAEQLGLLMGGRKPLRTFLTLASNTQQSALEQSMHAFKQVNPEGCIITKVDEAASLGGVFSALIRQGLPLAFITDGQRVPEDMHLPRTQALVNRAVNMSQQFAIGHTEQYMALSLGGLRADAHH